MLPPHKHCNRNTTSRWVDLMIWWERLCSFNDIRLIFLNIFAACIGPILVRAKTKSKQQVTAGLYQGTVCFKSHKSIIYVFTSYVHSYDFSPQYIWHAFISQSVLHNTLHNTPWCSALDWDSSGIHSHHNPLVHSVFYTGWCFSISWCVAQLPL